MKYLIIGAGGTGGCMGAYMTKAGKDVTLIARGAHLKAMQENGLRMETTAKGSFVVEDIKATDMEHYEEKPDVIFVCVKGYSLEETIPFIRRVAKPETVVIPVLNIYGTGGRMQKELPELLVTDGCIYIVGMIKEPGCLFQSGNLFRVVFGVREPEEYRQVLADIKKDLEDSEIECVLSDNIRKDAMRKFSYISPAAACGQYYRAASDDIQKPGEIRETFKTLISEIMILSKAMGITFEEDMVATNVAIMDSLAPGVKTSMQRDVEAGKKSELDGLVYSVARLGEEYGVSLPMYQKISEKLQQEYE
ncbi:MAG: 2-dehydropantoate 2-reductase [Lachnospiraceae bacterium]|nr:2-dehydropantoate 2-reductase [Lachnospiraceae bacterium]